jgi:predicted alpha/beta hydrolase
VTRAHATLVADDGRALNAVWFRPVTPPRGVVVLAPAMATPSTYYHPLATYLADQGYAVLTFDYRGLEPGADLRTEVADLRAWAHDAAVALEAAHADRDQGGSRLPLTWVGHSFGGQVLAFVDHTLIDQVVLVATGHGHWRHNPPRLRRVVRIFWHLVVPASVALAGYYPGRRLHFLADLPAPAMKQWRRWCLHREYWMADVPDIRERHAEIHAPVTAIHLDDDELVTESGITAMLDQLTGARTELVCLTPAALGATRVGHHGFFHAQFAPAWREVLVPRLATAEPFARSSAR